MFSRIAPQKVRHSSGFVVQVASREKVELIRTDGSVAAVEVDFSDLTGIYAESLTLRSHDGATVVINSHERAELLQQIQEGLEAMGCRCEVVP